MILIERADLIKLIQKNLDLDSVPEIRYFFISELRESLETLCLDLNLKTSPMVEKYSNNTIHVKLISNKSRHLIYLSRLEANEEVPARAVHKTFQVDYAKTEVREKMKKIFE